MIELFDTQPRYSMNLEQEETQPGYLLQSRVSYPLTITHSNLFPIPQEDLPIFTVFVVVIVILFDYITWIDCERKPI